MGGRGHDRRTGRRLGWVGGAILKAPAVAAITLEPKGGGVAAASRLIWDAIRAHWGRDTRLFTLLVPDDSSSLDSSITARLRFGAGLATEQAIGRRPWIFYSHLSLAQVQARLPRVWQRPYVIFLHGIEAWCPLSGVQRAVIRRAALRVANSDYTARRVTEAHPGLGPIAVCPLALAVPLPRRGGAAPGPRPTVITVGRLSAAERYKGHDALLEAWPDVRRVRPDARLVVVGGGDDRGRLAEKARALGVSDAVEFTGFVPDERLAALYRDATVFAMPSRGEGFGLVYLEAMAYELPCIGSVHDAAREIIEDGVTGVLVDQGSQAELVDAITTLLGDERRARELGRRGRDRLEERFLPAHFAVRLTGLLESALGDTVQSPAALARRSL